MTWQLPHHWEAIIGLEIHVQLNTQTKLFCSAPNRFGNEPNTNIQVVDTGQPGSLPVLNKAAVEKALLFGLSTGATIAHECSFDRKSYFYPDNPRNYQITQFYRPILTGGSVIAHIDDQKKTFFIHHTHLEDDAGMLRHFSQFAGIDYNRAGVPLIEIVSEPCIRSPQEAVAYAMEIRSIAEYLNISDCNMEEGSLRIDANISVRKQGEQGLRKKTEIKNMNSFHNMEEALKTEIWRQVDLYEKHPDVDPHALITDGTYRFDIATGRIILMRKKESADDYRYFPEPDLPPLCISPNWIDFLKKQLPELPSARKKRYIEELQISEYSASILINDKQLCDLFEKGLTIAENPITFCNWLTVEFVGRVKSLKTTLIQHGIDVLAIARLTNMIGKTITGNIAKQIADMMMEDVQKTPEEILHDHPHFLTLHDTSQIEKMVNDVLKENAASVADYQQGKERAFNFLVGQVMKASRGSAPPETVRDLVHKKIQERG